MFQTSEQIIAQLSEYDFIIAIDTSGSMGEPVKLGATKSRWEHVQESAMAMIRDVSSIDSDGVGLVTFGGTTAIAYDGVAADTAREVFANTSPRGGTPLAEALIECFKLAGKSDKKDMIIVFTDGVPSDRAAAAAQIVKQANSQTADSDCTVLFIQVGDDTSASAYLKSLDDDLQGAKFDIVDTKTIEEADAFSSTAELVIAAIND